MNQPSPEEWMKAMGFELMSYPLMSYPFGDRLAWHHTWKNVAVSQEVVDDINKVPELKEIIIEQLEAAGTK